MASDRERKVGYQEGYNAGQRVVRQLKQELKLVRMELLRCRASLDSKTDSIILPAPANRSLTFDDL